MPVLELAAALPEGLLTLAGDLPCLAAVVRAPAAAARELADLWALLRCARGTSSSDDEEESESEPESEDEPEEDWSSSELSEATTRFLPLVVAAGCCIGRGGTVLVEAIALGAAASFAESALGGESGLVVVVARERCCITTAGSAFPLSGALEGVASAGMLLLLLSLHPHEELHDMPLHAAAIFDGCCGCFGAEPCAAADSAACADVVAAAGA